MYGYITCAQTLLRAKLTALGIDPRSERGSQSLDFTLVAVAVAAGAILLGGIIYVAIQNNAANIPNPAPIPG